MTFQVQLDQVSSEYIYVPYRIWNGSTVDDADRYYHSGRYSTGTLSFRPGDTVEEITANVSGDFEVESDEAITLELLQPTNADLGTDMLSRQVAGWIYDDDGATDPTSLWISNPVVMEGNSGTTTITYQMELSRVADRNYAIDWSLDGSATAGSDFVDGSGTVRIASGGRTAEVEVRVRGDTTIESLEHIDLKVDLPRGVSESTGGQATIIDDDSGQGPFVTARGRAVSENDTRYTRLEYQVTLSNPTSETVSVPWRLQSGTATVGEDTYYSDGRYVAGTLSFRPGDMQETITAYIAGDTLLEPDESFILELLKPVNGRLPGGVEILQAPGFVIDDDSVGDRTTLFVSNAQVRETDTGSSTASFRFELSRPAERDLVFRYSTIDGSAKAGKDYVGTSGSVTIAEGQSTASVGVKVLGDNGLEADETFRLNVRLPAGVVTSTIGDGTILNDDDGSPEEIDGNGRANTIRGAEFREIIDGKGGDDRLFAFAGNDTVFGGAGNDLVFGGGGRDRLFGQNGNDRLLGLGGNDVARGGGGRDTVEGGKGDDRLFGDGGNDLLIGGAGDDRLSGGGGRDRLVGGGGADDLDGGGGNDRASGGGGRDRLSGDGGDDRLAGNSGNDRLAGGNGADILSGGGGRDRLDGGQGNDRLTGGGGSDQFVFRANMGRDTVTDYDDRQDVIRIASGANGFRELDISQRGENAIIEIRGTDIVLLSTDADDLAANDFLF